MSLTFESRVSVHPRRSDLICVTPADEADSFYRRLELQTHARRETLILPVLRALIHNVLVRWTRSKMYPDLTAYCVEEVVEVHIWPFLFDPPFQE